MENFDPAPPDELLEEEETAWKQSHDTRERIKHVLIGLREPTPVSQIAESAHCAAKTARKHLEAFADERLALKIDDPQGTRYCRNDEYFAWRRAHQLSVEHTETALLDRLGELEARVQAYQNQFDATAPSDVAFPPEDATHEEIHELWEALTTWETVVRDIDRYREALRLSRKRSNDTLFAD